MRWTWVGALALVVCGNCVNGDDNSDAAVQGSLGGPCYANGTCNSGLVCTPNGNTLVCEAPDATVDALGDQSTADAGDAASEAAPTCDAAIGGLACSFDCFDGGCCPKQEMCQMSFGDAGPLCSGVDFWACQHAGDCPSNVPACCASVTATDLTQCPPVYAASTSSGPFCAAACTGSGALQLCNSNAECASLAKKCQAAVVMGYTVGACM